MLCLIDEGISVVTTPLDVGELKYEIMVMVDDGWAATVAEGLPWVCLMAALGKGLVLVGEEEDVLPVILALLKERHGLSSVEAAAWVESACRRCKSALYNHP